MGMGTGMEMRLRNGDENATEIENNMWDYNANPDAITYNTVLNGLCNTTMSEDVIETFQEMVDKGFVPN
ncbi:putative pentatricopeptide repeat-containing protein, partial [Tanacetum coccineum]